jgi:hypothetical protein
VNAASDNTSDEPCTLEALSDFRQAQNFPTFRIKPPQSQKRLKDEGIRPDRLQPEYFAVAVFAVTERSEIV